MSPTQAVELGGIYGITAAGVFVIALIVGIVIATRNDDIAVNVVLAILAALMIAMVWPLALLAGTVTGIVMGARHLTDRRHQAKREAEMAARYAPPPETDAQKFKRMAREQRDLAAKSRQLGWDEIADMQDNLANQYADTAKMYATIGATK